MYPGTNPDLLNESYAVGYQIGFVVGQLLVPLVVVVILLISRRNMKGWNQPVKYVWFSFSGRLNRKAFWLKGFLLQTIVILVARYAFVALLFFINEIITSASWMATAIVVFLVLPLIVFQIWVGWAINIKRAHDLGHSGWWLLTLLIPVWNFWVIIQLDFFRGSIGPNRFGPDPLDPYNDFVEEPTGGGHGGGSSGEVKGFGRRNVQVEAPAGTAPPDVISEPQLQPDTPMPSDNRDIITRRLGKTIMRPVQRKPRG